jgi:hypothetical protein
MDLKELGDGGFEFCGGNGQRYQARPLDLDDEAQFDAWICGERIRRLKAVAATGEIAVTTEALLQAVAPPNYSERLSWMQSPEGGRHLVWLSLHKAKHDLSREAIGLIVRERSELVPLVLRLSGYTRPPAAEGDAKKGPAASTSPSPGT